MLENPSSLVLLLFLLPVILLYLLKPKPKSRKMPSLMLLISPQKKRSFRSFFGIIIRDPLLLIQLAAITILVISLVDPYFLTNTQYENTVIVLDNSASMSARDVSPDRFSQAVEIASEYIKSGRTSLILAGSTPMLVFKDTDSEKAIRDLKEQKTASTGTDLNEAMMLAAQMLERNNGRLVVISDFSGQDIIYARKTIEARNIPVEYRQVGTGGSNAGIIEASMGNGYVKFAVKNYGAFEKTINIGLGDTISQTLVIKPGSKGFFNIPVHPGKNTIFLEPQDDLQADNFLYVSMPELMKRKTLILSDKVEKNPVSIALNSIPDVQVDEETFLRAPRKPDHSIVILYNYTKDSLLPGTIDDLRNFAEEGGMLVFEAEDDLEFMDTKGLLPVEVSGRAKPSSFKVAKTDITEGLEFGISGYLNATLKDGAVALTWAPEGPVIAYWNLGRGKVVYIGMNDLWGDFHLQVSYPIFWYRLLGSEDPAIEEQNFKTGTIIPLGISKTIAAPHGNIETSDLYLGDAGFYTFGERTVAANLLDEKESDISIENVLSKDIENRDVEKTFSTKVEKLHLDVLFSFIAIILLAFELYYLKRRGDI